MNDCIRWGNFYDESQFLWTNFFNGHFFRGESRTTFQNFLINADRLLIVVDPPFGAKSELIHHCLSRIKDQLGDKLFQKCCPSIILITHVFNYLSNIFNGG